MLLDSMQMSKAHCQPNGSIITSRCSNTKDDWSQHDEVFQAIVMTSYQNQSCERTHLRCCRSQQEAAEQARVQAGPPPRARAAQAAPRACPPAAQQSKSCPSIIELKGVVALTLACQGPYEQGD